MALRQQDDLHVFRTRHFQDVPEHHSSYDFDEEEDDGLGYYPDGVKRTLTDDQVAMFRHSEIYAILRERLVRKENADADQDEVHSSSSKSTPAAAAEGRAELKEGIEGDSDDEEEYARFLEMEQKEMQAEAARRNKRKRSIADGNDERERPPTMRRIAREMDEATADDTVLDYGEEDAPDGTASSRPQDLDKMNGRKKVSYEDESIETATAEQQPAREGRKIWWPTIGAP